ncbi:MAG: hypothetical protein NVSMB1_20770 [Polyangiales bacterium]
MADNPAVIGASEAFLDSVFGAGEGRKHTAFLAHLENDALRDAVHRCHAMEADTALLSVEENYLIGMSVLCANRAFGPAAMFAKTLRHLGVQREKILEAIARLSMWIGAVQAAEAASHIQRALHEYDQTGKASLAAWFPDR